MVAEAKDSEILATAMSFIDRPEKWCKRRVFDIIRGEIAFCAEGAIRHAMQARYPHHPAGIVGPLAELYVGALHSHAQEERVWGRIRCALEEIDPRVCELGEYGLAGPNDIDYMTHDTMYAAFEKARAKALEEGN
jgi:hypothetical protein